MSRMTLAVLMLSLATSTSAEAAGLGLNDAADKLTSRIPAIGNLVSPKGVTLPVLGKLPGLNIPLGQIPVLAGVNASDLMNAVNVGQMGQDTSRVLLHAVQNVDLAR